MFNAPASGQRSGLVVFIALQLIAGITFQPPTPLPPLVAHGCYQSHLVLGTDNVPVSSGRTTTVVNIFVVKDAAALPLAWIYKNASEQYWIQANTSRAAAVRQVFDSKTAAWLLTVPPKSDFAAFRKMTTANEFDARFAQTGANRIDCFSRDLPATAY